MERNQFLNCNGLIQEVAAKTQKKSAYIKIGIPDETAEKMLKQIALGDVTPITSLVLTWLDHDLPQIKKLCENCKFCIEDNNDTDIWVECRKKDSPIEHNSLLSEKGYPHVINFSCSEWESKS